MCTRTKHSPRRERTDLRYHPLVIRPSLVLVLAAACTAAEPPPRLEEDVFIAVVPGAGQVRAFVTLRALPEVWPETAPIDVKVSHQGA